MTRYIIVDYFDDPTCRFEFYDSLDDAAWRALEISKSCRTPVDLGDLTEEDLLPSEDGEELDLSDDLTWENHDGYGRDISVTFRRGEIVIGEYRYESLFNLYEATKMGEALNALGQWLDVYGGDSWNGECYDCSFTDRHGVKRGEGMLIRPVYSSDDEDCRCVIGYEVC